MYAVFIVSLFCFFGLTCILFLALAILREQYLINV